MYLRHQTYTLYYRDVCILVFMYLRISCYCDACLNSSDLRVGVTTLFNTIQKNIFNDDFCIGYDDINFSKNCFLRDWLVTYGRLHFFVVICA